MSNTTDFYWMPKLKFVVNNKSRTKRGGQVPQEREAIEELTPPIKSLNDDKIYRTIRLRNGLTALLISDPTKFGQEGKAACALSVNVGSFSDPNEIQGLAHFVEHMVFMGSERFPVENQFDMFLARTGGTNDAFTANEVTTFVFDIEEPHLLGAMEMMSHFFMSPLMRKEAMQREREAVDSEFADRVLEDFSRSDRLLFCTFPKLHPLTKFTYGNLKSLRQEVEDDDLHCKAHQFRARHYSAHRMTLAVQASMDMSTLESIVAKTFALIPSNGSPPDDFSRFAYSADSITPEFCSLYYVKPVSDASEVQITWCMRSLRSEYQSKPLQYIAYFLQYEGRGSLLSYLKNKIWALNIRAEDTDDFLGFSSLNTFFTTRIGLTKDGLEHLSEVIEAVFSYIVMLRDVGPLETIFYELKTLAYSKFYYLKSPEPYDNVRSLSSKMNFYPPEHYITGDQLYFKYNPTVIKEVLDVLRANNVNIRVLSNKHSEPIQYNDKEKWFGVEYRREAIPQEWLQRWTNVAPYPEFQIPEENVYITTDFEVIPLATPYEETAEKLGLDLDRSSLHEIWQMTASRQPERKKFQKDDLSLIVNKFRLERPNLFRKDPLMELWYKPELKWRLPIAMLYFYFVLPLSMFTPRELCLLDLWNNVVQRGIQEEIYRAELAHLSFNMNVDNKGLMLKISGYSQHLPLLIDSTTSGMRNATEALTPKMFEALRGLLASSYRNDLSKESLLLKDVFKSILQQPYISLRDKADWIDKITFEELKDFDRRVLKRMYLQVLIQGNIPWYQAISIAEKVHQDLRWVNLPVEEQFEVQDRQLPLGERRVRAKSLNKFSPNSIVTNYYQGEISTNKDRAVIFQIMEMMEEKLFYTLRTKEQLCYTVSNKRHSKFGVLGFSISVHTQVNKHSVQHVEQRIEAFLKNFLWELQTRASSRCKPSHGLVKVIKSEESFEEEVERNWEEVINREYNFHRLFREWSADGALTMEDIINWVKNHFASGNKSMFRKLSVQIEGNKESEDDKTPAVEPGPSEMADYKLTYLNGDAKEKASEFITDVEKFSKSLPLMKVPKVQLT